MRRQVRIDTVKVDVAPDDGIFLACKNQFSIILQRGQRTGQQDTISALPQQFMRLLYLDFVNYAIIFIIKGIDDVAVSAVNDHPAVALYGLGRTPAHHWNKCFIGVVCSIIVIQPFRKAGHQALVNAYCVSIKVNTLGILGITKGFHDSILLIRGHRCKECAGNWHIN